MSVSDKIGLLPGFGWVADQHWFGDSWWSHLLSTLLVCWLLTPVGHIVFAYLAQATVVPLDSERQWRSFFPGDLYLGAAIAVAIFAAGQMDDIQVDRWWQSRLFHGLVLTFTLLVAFVMTWFLDRNGMPLSALLSPSKLYHNFLLYGGYGYVAVVSLVAAIAGNGLSTKLLLVVLALILVAPWVKLVMDDSKLTPEQVIAKQEHAHPADYWLFWIIHVSGSYRK